MKNELRKPKVLLGSRKRSIKMAETPAVPAAPKPRSKKQPPLAPEEFGAKVAQVIADFMPIMNYFVGSHKHKFEVLENAPSKAEFQNVIGILEKLVKQYEKLAKKPKRKAAAGGAIKGFKQAKLVCPAGVKFVNEHGDLPAHLHLVALPQADGWGIWNIAQATQLIQSYVERHHLKDPKARSHITFDKVLTELFRPLIDTVERKAWSLTEDGRIVTNHNTLQALIPRIFESIVAVPAKLIDEAETKRSLEREVILSQRTHENVYAREILKEDARKEAQAARELKRKKPVAPDFMKAAAAATPVAATPAVATPAK